MIDARAGEGTRTSIAGKEATHDVGQALPDKLLVAIDPLVCPGGNGPPDSDRLNQAQQSHGEGTGRQLTDVGDAQVGEIEGGELGGHLLHKIDASVFSSQQKRQHGTQDHRDEQVR